MSSCDDLKELSELEEGCLYEFVEFNFCKQDSFSKPFHQWASFSSSGCKNGYNIIGDVFIFIKHTEKTEGTLTTFDTFSVFSKFGMSLILKAKFSRGPACKKVA